MASPEKKRSPLIALEDWWTVWFGLVIILVATGLAVAHYSGDMPLLKVPKMGKWVSNPTDVFYASKKTQLKLKDEVTLGQLAEEINAKKPKATAAIVPASGGVQLKIASDRDGDKAVIKVSPNLMGGEAIKFTKEQADSGGLGARAYVSNVFPSESVNLGKGLFTITAQRTKSIIPSLVIAMILVGILTAIGVAVMGQDPKKYLFAFFILILLAVVSYLIANQAQVKGWGLSYAMWALLFGLLISNTIGTPEWLKPGIRTEMYIKTGLVLLGAEILFGKILSLGAPGLMVAWIVTPTVVIFMYIFGVKFLKMKSKCLVIIIAAATSVCGVSAAIAAAGASRAKKEELTMGVGMTLIFTVLMMVFMPMAIKAAGMNDVLGAAWMGGTIDSTGAVVAAGSMLGPRAETVAAVVKMIQNVLIGVLGFFIAVYWVTSVDRDPNAPRPSLMEVWVRFPKFIIGFIGASILFSFVLVPLFGSMFDGDGIKLVEKGVIKAVTNPLRGWFFCLAFVAIGLESNFKELAKQMEGGKPMILYVVGQSFNLILTLLIAWLAFMVVFPNSI
jgi:uncharacterized integral membrane protein (TIGR00698 family)